MATRPSGVSSTPSAETGANTPQSEDGAIKDAPVLEWGEEGTRTAGMVRLPGEEFREPTPEEIAAKEATDKAANKGEDTPESPAPVVASVPTVPAPIRLIAVGMAGVSVLLPPNNRLVTFDAQGVSEEIDAETADATCAGVPGYLRHAQEAL